MCEDGDERGSRGLVGVRDVRGRGWEPALSEALCAVCNWLCGCAWASAWARLGVTGVARGERDERHREAGPSAPPRQNAREPELTAAYPVIKVKHIVLKVPYGCVPHASSSRCTAAISIVHVYRL